MLRVLHKVSWTEVDLQLTDSICQNPVLSRISVNKPVNADLNASPPGTILERVDPVQVAVGRLYAHTENVAHGLHLVNHKCATNLRSNVRAKLPGEAGGVRPARDDAPCAADQPYAACRSGSA